MPYIQKMTMDEKHAVLPLTEHQNKDDAAPLQGRPRWRRDFKALFASLSTSLLLYLTVTLLRYPNQLSCLLAGRHYYDHAEPKLEGPVRRVPLEAHIMLVHFHPCSETFVNTGTGLSVLMRGTACAIS